MKQKLTKFWKDSDIVIRDAPSGLPIKDIANLSVVIKDAIIPEGDLKELGPDAKVFFASLISLSFSTFWAYGIFRQTIKDNFLKLVKIKETTPIIMGFLAFCCP